MNYPKISRILAVDDAPDNLLLIETLLEDLEEYELICVDNGPAALEEISLRAPDLILLDVMMPEMDGYEVTRNIRNNPELPFIPILLLTADRQADVPLGLDIGADDFIRKPFRFEELMARIRALLRLKHSIDQQNMILRQRDDFVARLTHDMRTPLIAANRILEFCNRGSYGETLETLSPHLKSVIESNDQLLHMVNSLLEVYRHEANRKELTLIPLNLALLLEKVVAQLTPLAGDKDLDLNFDKAEQLSNSEEWMVMGDRVEIMRVLTNIIGNAIKFTEQGGVTISLEIQPAVKSAQSNESNNSAPYVIVKISDTGAGLSPQSLGTLFDWFRPGAHINSGSGLGLHLSQRIIEKHQGQIKVESQLGEGSTFYIQLPKI